MSDEPKDWLTEIQNGPIGQAIRAQCDEQEDVPGERSGGGWSGTIYGACPVQGHGVVDGLFWYFRSRHDEWRFEVYPTSCASELPPDATLIWDRFGSYNGDAPNAGWMKFSEAWNIIERKIALYRRERGPTDAIPTGGSDAKR